MRPDNRREMSGLNIETQYFNLNRILLLTIGLWPYQRTKFVHFWIVLLFSILMSSIVFQLTTFMTASLSAKFVIKILSHMLLFTMFMINYISFWVNAENTKRLLEHLEHIYNELRDENEIAILEKYRYDGRRYTINILLLTTSSLAAITIQLFWPYILSVLPFTNGSQSCRTVPIRTEYFIDQEKYFYIIMLHMSAAFCVGGITVIATGTLLIISLKHACGMFMIASYRIEQAMTNNVYKNINLQNEILIYKGIIYAVDIHRKAMQFAEIVINSFGGMYFWLITISVLCLSSNFYCMMSVGNDIKEMMLNVICGFVIILYMFLANYAGQEITDHNDYVYHIAYDVCWYLAPLHVQKLILFLLQRGNKTFHLTVSGLFSASLECFASLASASVSYFTVMYSTQK